MQGNFAVLPCHNESGPLLPPTWNGVAQGAAGPSETSMHALLLLASRWFQVFFSHS
jgi:hypothetical protein